MADSHSAANPSNFSLTEDDIPGAKLPKESPEECNCWMLRRWIQCRGGGTTGKKAVLVQRVKDYMKLNRKLVDPDAGINTIKKKARLGLCDDISPESRSLKGFPTEGYTDDLSDIPNIDYNMIWKFMVQNVAGKGTSTAKPLIKGYNFFKSGHIVKLEKHNRILSEDGLIHIRGRILPSMKKNIVYTAYITLKDSKVLRGKCGCPAGIKGHCNHVSAMLFFLEESCKQNAENRPCTSQPCTWNKPSRKRKVDNLPIHQVKFTKHEHGKKKTVVSPRNDVRALHQRHLSRTELYDFRCKLESLASKGQDIGLLHILPRKSTQEVLEDINHDHDYCKLSSDTETSTLNGAKSIGQGDAIISPPKVYPVSIDELKGRCSRIKRKLDLDRDQIKLIESETRDQSMTAESKLKWNDARKVRITASKCKRVATMRETTSPNIALQEILHYKQPHQTNLMREGLEKEPEIISEYITENERNGHPVTVTKSGFVVSETHGFLGASPDGLVNDPLGSPADGLIEVKHISLQSEETLRDALVRKGICRLVRDPEITINRNHQYFFQVQQQMFCMQKVWTDFVVKGGTDIYKERVYFDNIFWSELLPKLEIFFDNIMLPELAYPRVKYGLSCFDLRSV